MHSIRLHPPNNKVGKVSRGVFDEGSHDSVFIEANEEDFTEAIDFAECLNMMPYHRSSCNGKERLAVESLSVSEVSFVLVLHATESKSGRSTRHARNIE